MGNVLFGVAAAACWAVALFHLIRLPRARDRAVNVALIVSVAALGAAAALQIPALASVVDHASGKPTIAKLSSHSLTLLSACAAEAVLVLALAPDRVHAVTRLRRRVLVVAAAVALMVSAVLLAPAGAPPIRARDGVVLPTPAGVCYAIVFTGYLGIATFDLTRLTWRYARVSDRTFVRLGLFVGACGVAVSTGYCAVKLALVLARLAGIESQPLEHAVIGPIVGVALLLMIAGTILPAMSGWSILHRPVLWLVRLWTYRSLGPLWSRLVGGTDVARLLPTDSVLRGAAAGLSLQLLLHRRVTEISDGLLQLRTYRDPAVAREADTLAAAAGLATAERHAAVEAASIDAALRRHAAHAPVAEPDPAQPPPFSDLDRKAWWLQQVSWALRRPRTRERRDRVAAVVNEALAPAVLVAAQLVLVGWHAGRDAGVSRWWGLPAALFAAVIPMGYVVRGVRQGRFTSHHIPEREHRPVPMAVAIVSIAAGLAGLYLLGAPRDIVALLAAGTAGLAVFTVITRWWKISLHTGVAGGTVVVLTCVYGPVGLLALPFVILVCWARMRVSAHTLAQVGAGAVVGALIAASVFPILR